MKHYRLSFSAPSRNWIPGTNGWHSERWTVEAVRLAKSGGAWFTKGRHEFADKKAAMEAGVAE